MSCYSIVYIGPELSEDLISDLEYDINLREELTDFSFNTQVVELFHFTNYSEGNTVICGLGKTISESNGFNIEIDFSSPEAFKKINETKLEVLAAIKKHPLFHELRLEDIKVLHTMYQDA